MAGEIWTYLATMPNNGKAKARPILIIGNDDNNQLKYVDMHYVLISSSADCGIYDIEIQETDAKRIGLNGKSVIKTTKIYTGARTSLGSKICDLPEELKKEFIKKYSEYQQSIINKLNEI